jgi:hypothetical protein
MSPSRYCLTLGAAALAIAGAVAAFNYAVDPYLLFDVKRVAGFNDLKPAATTRERMMKAYQVERLDARTIVIGSSRPDLGIDPASAAWPAQAQPVYNMGLVGGDVPDGLKYLRHYVAMHPGHAPKTLVVGLDFENNLYVPSATPATQHPLSEVEERLAIDPSGKPNPARGARVMKDRAQGLLSLDALFDSIGTVRSNRSGAVLSLERNGHLSEAAMRDVVRADGYALVLGQKDEETVKLLAKPRRVLADTPGAPSRKLMVVRELLAFAKANGSDVILMIQPAYVSRLELLDRLGYWADYEHWKREVTAIAAEAGAGQKVALWDFGGYESLMQSPKPAKGKGTMAWSWDTIHYTSALGNVMVKRMFDPAQSGDFGVLLTPANIDARLAQVRADRDAFRVRMPQETARLARLACGNQPCGVTPPAPLPALATARP